MPVLDQLDSWHLFWSALISATLFPGGSEVLLALLLERSEYPPWQLVLVATLGNTLGSLVTWLMGVMLRYGYTIPMLSTTDNKSSHAVIKRYGIYSLLLAWLPVIGDGICLICGYLKTPLLLSSLLILIGKSCRYLIIWLMIS